MSPENLPYYINKLNSFKPKSIDGFITSICTLAEYIVKNGIVLSFTPIAIFVTSEKVSVEDRSLVEKAFRCKVFDQYASSEGAPFLTECKNQVKHVEMSSGIFENGDNNEMLVTSFTTHLTPLIRYRIGDCMTFSDDTICTCGNQTQIVKEILGRNKDFLFSSSGGKINAGCVSNILKAVPNAVIRTQFIQEDMDSILLRMVVDKDVFNDEYLKIISNDFRSTLGEKMKMRVEIVDKIIPNESGKTPMIINKVKE